MRDIYHRITQNIVLQTSFSKVHILISKYKFVIFIGK